MATNVNERMQSLYDSLSVSEAAALTRITLRSVAVGEMAEAIREVYDPGDIADIREELGA